MPDLVHRRPDRGADQDDRAGRRTGCSVRSKKGAPRCPGCIPRPRNRPGAWSSAFLWLFALALAFPYLPGSDTDAFKGVSVFVGCRSRSARAASSTRSMSGLTLTYSRALRLGDFVRIGDIEGTVTTRPPRDQAQDPAPRGGHHSQRGRRRRSRRPTTRDSRQRRRLCRHRGDDRLRHAVASGAGPAADGGGADRRRADDTRAVRAADRPARLLRRIHAARLPGESVAARADPRSPARAHSGRVQRARRADHVAELRGRSRGTEDGVAGPLVRFAGFTAASPAAER